MALSGTFQRVQAQEHAASIEISLDPKLLNTRRCRRSRRCLREIQTACQATMKRDRVRGVLRVCGPESSMEDVRRQLETLGGPSKPVSASVWAELMRTRTMRSGPQAVVVRLQEQSGCRIHIERNKREVRLFGPNEGVTVVDRLLDEFAGLCAEASMPIVGSTPIYPPMLNDLAQACGATFCVEEDRIVVLGLQAAVTRSVGELARYMDSPEEYQMPGGMSAEEDDDSDLNFGEEEEAFWPQKRSGGHGAATTVFGAAPVADISPSSSGACSRRVSAGSTTTCSTSAEGLADFVSVTRVSSIGSNRSSLCAARPEGATPETPKAFAPAWQPQRHMLHQPLPPPPPPQRPYVPHGFDSSAVAGHHHATAASVAAAATMGAPPAQPQLGLHATGKVSTPGMLQSVPYCFPTNMVCGSRSRGQVAGQTAIFGTEAPAPFMQAYMVPVHAGLHGAGHDVAYMAPAPFMQAYMVPVGQQ